MPGARGTFTITEGWPSDTFYRVPAAGQAGNQHVSGPTDAKSGTGALRKRLTVMTPGRRIMIEMDLTGTEYHAPRT